MSKIINVLVEVVIFASLIGSIFYYIGIATTNMTGMSVILVGSLGVFITLGFIVVILRELGLYHGGR